MPFHISVNVHIYSLVPVRPTLVLFDVYTQRVHRSCPVEGVSIVLRLRSVHILPGWRGYVQSCYASVEEWTNKFQLDLEVRNIYYQDCKFLFLSVS
jgi:hypothetical protein